MDNTVKNQGALSFGVSKTIIWIALITILYLARDILAIGFPQSIFTLICLIAFLTTSIEEGLCIFVFSMALTLPGNEIRLAYFVIFLIKQKHIVRRLKSFNAFILLILINELIISYFYFSGSKFQFLYNFLIYALYLLIPILWSQYTFDREAIISSIKCFVVGIILASIITLYMAVRSRGWGVVLSGSYSLGKVASEYVTGSTMVTSNNRNGLAVQASIAISLILLLLAQKKARLLPSSVASALLLMVVLLTRSRTGVIMIAMIIIFWVLTISSKRGHFLSGLCIAGGFVLLIIGLYWLFPSAWNGVYARFINQTDITNGRNELSILYLGKWKDNILSVLFGYGKNTYFDVLGIDGVPHNMIVDVLTCSGLIGLLSLLAWLFLYLKNNLKDVEKEQVFYALLTPIMYFFSTMAGQYFSVALTHLVFSFLLLSSAAMGNDRTEQTLVSGGV